MNTIMSQLQARSMLFSSTIYDTHAMTDQNHLKPEELAYISKSSVYYFKNQCMSISLFILLQKEIIGQ